MDAVSKRANDPREFHRNELFRSLQSPSQIINNICKGHCEVSHMNFAEGTIAKTDERPKCECVATEISCYKRPRLPDSVHACPPSSCSCEQQALGRMCHVIIHHQGPMNGGSGAAL